jgi:hypothetical protein
VLDQSVVSVKHEGWQQKRYGADGLLHVAEPAAGELPVPEPRDNGTARAVERAARRGARGPGEWHADRGAPPPKRPAADPHNEYHSKCSQ